MQFKIGKFDAYLPDKSLCSTVMEILSLIDNSKGSELNSPLSKFHKFFYEMKKSHPSIFENVFFSDDLEFPYSEEVDECFIKLQESGYITRPNPSLFVFKLDSEFSSKKPGSTREDLSELNSIAKSFESYFSVKNAPTC